MFLKSLIAITFVFSTSVFAQTAGLSDGEIANVLSTINEGEVDAAKMAKDKASNPEVKAFAKMMLDEHKKNEKDTEKLVKKIKSDKKDSDIAKALKADAKTANEALGRVTKEQFDKAYIQQQISMHEKALDKLSNMLIPGAQNPELKSHLEKTRGAVQSHLEHAKSLNSKLM